MKAVIFAAGLGTRLRPLTDTVPKPLIEIGGKAILRRTLEALPAAADEVIVVVGYMGERVRSALQDAPLPVRFAEQPELLGTYDALMRAEPFLDEAPFMALNGDDLYVREDLARLSAAGPFAMLAHRVPSPSPYSHLETSGGFLRRIVPARDAATLAAKDVYVGACLLDRRFFGLEPGRTPAGEAGLPQTLERHLPGIPVRVLPSASWMPVGTPEELEAARARFA